MMLNDELNEEIGELKKVLPEYSNELDKLYSSNDTNSQKTIEEINKEKKGLEQKIIVLEKEKKELEEEINIIEKSKNSINNELAHAIRIIKKGKKILKNLVNMVLIKMVLIEMVLIEMVLI